jgi:purine-binding chemotaxis protein CheW
VPVVDAGLLLGGEEANASRFVSIRIGERTVALAVDAVLGVRAIADDDLRELPPLLGGASGDVIALLGQLDSEMLVVLEDARLVPDSVWVMIDGQVSA